MVANAALQMIALGVARRQQRRTPGGERAKVLSGAEIRLSKLFTTRNPAIIHGKDAVTARPGGLHRRTRKESRY
jgi:hypothetical protein